jgi:hypothetical protein
MTRWNANPVGRPSCAGRIAIAAAAALAVIASVPTAARDVDRLRAHQQWRIDGYVRRIRYTGFDHWRIYL